MSPYADTIGLCNKLLLLLPLLREHGDPMVSAARPTLESQPTG